MWQVLGDRKHEPDPAQELIGPRRSSAAPTYSSILAANMLNRAASSPGGNSTPVSSSRAAGYSDSNKAGSALGTEDARTISVANAARASISGSQLASMQKIGPRLRAEGLMAPPASDAATLRRQVAALQLDLESHVEGEKRLQGLNQQLRERASSLEKEKKELEQALRKCLEEFDLERSSLQSRITRLNDELREKSHSQARARAIQKHKETLLDNCFRKSLLRRSLHNFKKAMQNQRLLSYYDIMAKEFVKYRSLKSGFSALRLATKRALKIREAHDRQAKLESSFRHGKAFECRRASVYKCGKKALEKALYAWKSIVRVKRIKLLKSEQAAKSGTSKCKQRTMWRKKKEMKASVCRKRRDRKAQCEEQKQQTTAVDVENLQLIDRLHAMSSEIALLKITIAEKERQEEDLRHALEDGAVIEGSLHGDLEQQNMRIEELELDVLNLQALKDTAEKLEGASDESQEKLTSAFEIAASLRRLLEDRENQYATLEGNCRIGQMQEAQQEYQELQRKLDMEEGSVRRLQYEMKLRSGMRFVISKDIANCVTDRDSQRTKAFVSSLSSWTDTVSAKANQCSGPLTQINGSMRNVYNEARAALQADGATSEKQSLEPWDLHESSKLSKETLNEETSCVPQLSQDNSEQGILYRPLLDELESKEQTGEKVEKLHEEIQELQARIMSRLKDPDLSEVEHNVLIM
ncbi:meiosis-specific nuclear structural protein 1-like [Selaginella moellendorffii]|uniref:meiosis-specific nuclear structural protein 1-like n=1 Tax=Selaginella moellendorffii TaxID=88036 RepID=UPI000D1C775D|nr:meiosis-specific nuclear structural protein 1-like [Selaginella moellendorffii]|eukprot:XP_024530433.1 meiosis-specific nuclear structural protein 1-like [Selaginella moellendorffii]